jgi:hypothetical protein
MGNFGRKKLEILDVTLEEIIEKYGSGHLAIPEFQRDYVWRPSKAPKLLDSLLNQFPIGAMLTWSTDDDVHSRVKSAVHSPTQWIIDGQQRTRTLVKIMDGEIPLLFDLKEVTFLLENAATKKEQNSSKVPVADIWGSGYTRILKGLEEISKNQAELRLFEERLQRVRELLKFQIPKIHLSGHTLDEAIDAFRRINTQGMRLKATDIEVARLTVKHSGFVKNEIQPYLDSLKRRGWERVYLSQLFVTCEGVAEGGQRSSDYRKRLHDLTKSELREAWKKLTRGIDEAIVLLRDELGINNMAIFPSGNMLMPLAVLLIQKNRPVTKELIKWMIRVSITKRYSSSVMERLDEDIRLCYSQNPILALNKANRKRAKRAKIIPNANNFNAPLHDRYAMFLTYLACKLNGMRDLFSGQIVSSTSAEKHHIIPRASVSSSRRRSLDNSANIAFIIGPTNKKISKTEAKVYLKDISLALKTSQCIPSDEKLYEIPDKMISVRAKILSDIVQRYLED